MVEAPEGTFRMQQASGGTLFERTEAILASTSADDKVADVQCLWGDWQRGEVVLRHSNAPCLDRPGRPPRPALVHPRHLARRRAGSAEGRAALLHAIAHIEFNAIHLALDACYRFADLPREFYTDWLHVAGEEAIHFSLLDAALRQRGYCYGSFPAHDGLWEMAAKTRHDVVARMALVPRTLEARGLDVTPEIRLRFAEAKDAEAVAILDRILNDEIGHVAIGNRWYAWLCEARALDPESTFASLSAEFRAPRPRLPLNRDARLRGGFSERELDLLEQLARQAQSEESP
jgi:uncharacterized ferritin-like protein (DUF455 family)